MPTGSAKSLNRAAALVLAAGVAGTAAVMGVRAYSSGAATTARESGVQRGGTSDVQRAGTSGVERAGTSGVERAGTSGVEQGGTSGVERGHKPCGAEFAQSAADQLSELIRFRTVFAEQRDVIELEEFTGYIKALERLYPAVHATLGREPVNGHALLYKWSGTEPDAALKAVVLMAHYDVVPVDERDDWTHPGFSGYQDGKYVWGRGALDDKGAMVVILAAVESLLEQGFAPASDIYLSFGNNEESAGDSAMVAAETLRSRGVRPWFVLDEGGAVAENAFPGLTAPAAVIGVSEKGILDLELLARGAGGHASTPPRMGATARLARAIMALERTPFPSSMPDPIVEMMSRIGSHSSFGMRLITANMWAFKPLLTRAFAWLGDETRALTRTTVAFTMLEGSKASNVLASSARANANIRIAVGETVDTVVERVRRIIDDPEIELLVRGGHNPSPISPTDNEQFALLASCVAAAYPQAVVVPYVQTGATDSRNFTDICPAVYRFSPLLMDESDRASLHAVNEKVRIASLGAGVVFYRKLIQNVG